MILGLPIDDFPMCGLVSLVGWRDFVGEAINIRPPPPQRGRIPEGEEVIGRSLRVAHSSLCHLPEGVKDTVIQRYARSCLWHMTDELLFLNLI
jgi:hypothetical protein